MAGRIIFRQCGPVDSDFGLANWLSYFHSLAMCAKTSP